MRDNKVKNTDRVLLKVKDNGVAVVTMNRVEAKNALDADQLVALIEMAESLIKRKDIRAVVLKGKRGCFCAGIDVKGFGELAKTNAEHSSLRHSAPGNLFQAACTIWQEVPVPVIAAIEGYAIGAGFQLALGADIRIADPNAKIAILEIKWGLVPDMGFTLLAGNNIRMDMAKELMFTGRMVQGNEAVEMGLITQCSTQAVASAMAMADEIAAKSPDAIRAGKALLNKTWYVKDQNWLDLEEKSQARMLTSKNHLEAGLANMEGRAPNFGEAED
jgi:enoyl-CoA hydratase/carnithine racemase